MNPRGIVLFAHGSRDPLWRKPVEAVAARMREREPGALVICAYLELTEPDLVAATQNLLAQGAQTVRVVPMFLGVGRHAREDLPLLIDALKASHPQVVFTLQQAIGEDERLIDLMADIALL
ncbi:MAG: hypothetical protein RIS34_2122 [Pseudomonadota bacterium]|jgi:sirohydrochlorin cobaltochelatase